MHQVEVCSWLQEVHAEATLPLVSRGKASPQARGTAPFSRGATNRSLWLREDIVYAIAGQHVSRLMLFLPSPAFFE
jgi:hypothetical protein